MGLRQEIEGYMDEHGVKIRYAKSQATTCFMNRKVAMPKKSISGISQNDGEEEDVTDQQMPRELNSDLAFENMANSAIFTGVDGHSDGA